MKWWDLMPWSLIFECWVLIHHFHSLSFIRRLFNSYLLSAVKVVSFVYMRSLIFLLAILIPACASSSPEFHMIYSAYKLNKPGDNIQFWYSYFPILNQSVVLCLILTIASWSAFRFHRRQLRCFSILISLRIFHSLLWLVQSKALV